VGRRFLPKTEPIAPSPYLAEFLAESIPLAIATGSDSTIYGSVTSGNLWTFLKLEAQTLTLDLTEYLIPPVAAGT